MNLDDFAKLLRFNQWYKNLVVFLPILFSLNLFNLNLFLKVVLAFFSLCFISSVNYIINDIVDAPYDRKHPEKNSRPIAAKKIGVFSAIIIAAVLLFASVLLAYYLSYYFLYAILFLFFFTQLYSFFLRKESFADILAIGINFVARAVSGAFVINVFVSPWLVLGPFFLSLFLSLGKRDADIHFLGQNANQYRKTFHVYDAELINSLLIIVTACLIMSYALYSFLSIRYNLIYSLPFAMYIIFRYYYLIFSKSGIARKPEKLFKDSRILIGILLWLVSVIYILYYLK